VDAPGSTGSGPPAAAEGAPSGAAARREGNAAAPDAEFFAELERAFERLRPQGSLNWNFSDAFTRLETMFGEPARRPSLATPPPGAAPAGRGRRRAGARRGEAKPPATDAAVARAEDPEFVAEGFDATVEAFRFLGARVEALESAARRRHEPVDGLAWLVEPADLSGLAGPLAEWFGAHGPVGDVVHAEAGAGGLAARLGEAGVGVQCVEPRGALAWEVSSKGLPVSVEEAAGHLGGVAAGSVGGLVLSGVVDRVALDDVLALLSLALGRLAPGAPLVLVGAKPGPSGSGWSAVAADLLPGRPRHLETWVLLLERTGFSEVTPIVVTEQAAREFSVLGAVRPA